MQRLVDADKVAEAIAWLEIYDFALWHDVMECINKVPEVDAEPVVRCDDCIYRDGKTPGQPNILCWQMHSDDYCSYGTKREVGTYCENIVSVVRCKDCRYFNKYGFKLEYTECTHFDCDVTEEGYCAWGERREEERLVIPKADGSTIKIGKMDEAEENETD